MSLSDLRGGAGNSPKQGHPRDFRIVRSASLYAACIVLTIALIVVALERPEWALIALIVVLATALATRPLGRLLLFIGGIMTLFQSATVPGSVRAIFLGSVLVLSIPAAISMVKRARRIEISLRRFAAPTILLGLLIGNASVSLLWSARSPDDWLRDATTYVLIVIAPLFGIDAALHTRRRTIELIVLAVGVIGAFAYLVAWLSRRGYGILGIEQFALASSLVAIPSITMCLVKFYGRGRHRWLWGLAGLAQAGLLASSGGRSALIYLAALFGAFVALGGFVGPLIRRAVELIVLGVGVGVAIAAGTAGFGIQQYLADRYGWFQNASYSAVQSDLSGQARLRGLGYMLEGFQQAPLIGNGFGVNYTSVATGAIVVGTYSLDTPVTALSKFGLLGTALLIVALALLVRAMATVGNPDRGARRAVRVLLSGNVVVWVAMLLNGLPTEQKGFALQVALLAALSVVWSVQGTSSTNAAVQNLPARTQERRAASA